MDIYTCVYMHIYIYIYRERERHTHTHTHILYIYMQCSGMQVLYAQLTGEALYICCLM